MTTITVAVDARDLTEPLFPDDEVGVFVRHWADLEARMQGRSLQAGRPIRVHLESGDLVVEVLAPLGEIIVDPQSRFSVVAVRERPVVLETYRCATCRRDEESNYGPFICPRCPNDAQRVCDRHVVLLPGSLEATCPAHRPECAACGDAAAVRCPGPGCRGRTGWCALHLTTHSSDPDTAYCVECLAAMFPACGAGRCAGVGSIECDHLDPAGRPCPARRCPRHGRRWQVFGPHAQGLGRCEAHTTLQGLPADQLLYQVLGACTVRGRRPPTLPSLRHMLMKVTARQRPMDEVLQLAFAVPRTAPALRGELEELVRRREKEWRVAAETAVAALDDYTRVLRDWLARNSNHLAAEALEGSHWARPRDGRPGTLRVRCDPRLLPRPWRDAASAALGFEVRLERNA